MSRRSTTTIDVRDMLCAQALAVVGQAAESLQAGEVLDVMYNTEDVRRDLLIWARDRRYDACPVTRPASETVLRITLPSKRYLIPED